MPRLRNSVGYTLRESQDAVSMVLGSLSVLESDQVFPGSRDVVEVAEVNFP